MLKHLFTITSSVLFSAVALTIQAADVPLVYDVENTGAENEDPAFPSASQLPTISGLPDPFSWSDGSGRITDFCEWSSRRNEIKREIEYYEIGEKPSFESLKASYSGGTLTVTVSDQGRSLTLTCKLSIPSGSGPHPVVIGMDANTGSLSSSYFSRCIQIPFTHSQIAEYGGGFGSGSKSINDPFFKLYPNDFAKGDYCAWSWGISRIIDGLEIVKDQINADMSHIAVTGCSYAGKMALFAGAFDERIALTIAQESGGGGINSWRVCEQIGSDVEGISNTNYDWFMSSFKTNFNGKTGKIPYDHHELIAMIAPRAFLTFGNPGYTWLGDKSGYISLKAAEEVWKAMGIEDRFGYVIEGGHEHCQASSNQNSAADKFIKKFLYGDDSQNTTIRTSTVTDDYSSWISSWSGYELDMSNSNCGGPKIPDPEFTFIAPTQEKIYAGTDCTIEWNMEGEAASTYSLIWNTGSSDGKVSVSKVSASSEWTNGSTTWSVDNILTDDGNNGETSRWAAADGKSEGAWVEFTFDKSQTISGVNIDEFTEYGSIQEFEIQYDSNGTWETAYKGKTAGKNFSATFDPVMTSKARLNMTKVNDDLNINYVSFEGLSNIELTTGINASGSYVWSVPASLISTGTFSINKTASKTLASSSTISIEKDNLTSNNDIDFNNEITITPNPITKGKSQINLNVPMEMEASISINNMYGIQMMEMPIVKLEKGLNTVDFNSESLLSGIYYFTIKSDYFTVNKMVVVK